MLISAHTLFTPSYVGLASTMYIRCTYSIFGREVTKYTVIYGAHIGLWPTLGVRHHVHMGIHTVICWAHACRSGDDFNASRGVCSHQGQGAAGVFLLDTHFNIGSFC